MGCRGVREGDPREISSFLIDGGDDWDRKHREKEFVEVDRSSCF